MTAPTVRRATSEDLAPLAVLFDEYRRFYRMAPDPERAAAFLADRLRNRDSAVFLAEVGGRAAGFVQLYPMFSSVSIGRSFVLNDLFVDPAARGRGVGRLLLTRAAEYGRANGALYLELATEVANTSAQALYRSMGWERDDGFLHYALNLR